MSFQVSAVLIFGTLASAGLVVLSDSSMLEPASASQTLGIGSATAPPVAQPTSSLIQNYIPLGCYAEPVGGRILPTEFATDSMTFEQCGSFCAGKYKYFGLEYGRECWCGDSLFNAVSAPPSECNQPCAGDALETCGASSRLTLFMSTIPIPPPITPHSPVSVGGYNFSGCYTEGTIARALSSAVVIDYFGMTVEACAAACFGYEKFGVEYAGECYCGNSVAAGSIPAPLADCYFPCAGNAAEICGASDRLSLYTSNGLSVQSSIAAPVTSHSSIKFDMPSSTQEVAMSSSAAPAFVIEPTSVEPSSAEPTFAADPTSVDLSSIDPNSAKSSSVEPILVIDPSPTSSFEITSTNEPSSTMTTLYSSSTEATSTEIVTPTDVPGWSPIGCVFHVHTHRPRMKILRSRAPMSPQICADLAKAGLATHKPVTYQYMALENGSTCLAGTAAPMPATTMVGANACTMTCGKNPGSLCGGKHMYNLFVTAGATGAPYAAVATATAK